MPVRLLQDLHASGQVYKKGTEVDLDSIGIDQKSAIAEGLAEPINKVRTAEDEADLHAELEALRRENAELKAAAGDADEPKTMDRKARGRADDDAVRVTTGTNRPKDNA